MAIMPDMAGAPPAQPSIPQEPPANYVERLAGLAQTHPWMPHQTVATLAAMPQDDKTIANIAAQLKQMYGSVDHAVKYVTDDPLLQQTPSLGMYIRSYLTNAIGPMPLAESDLKHLQTQLLDRGFGVDQNIGFENAQRLQANGVWTTGWNTAFDQYLSSIRAQEMGGAQIGSVPVGKAIDALNQVLPRQAGTSLMAFIKNIPQSVVGDLHTFAGAVAGGAYNLGTQFEPKNLFNTNPQRNIKGEENVEAQAENLIPGSHVTPQTSFSAQGTRTQAMDVLSVAADILATHGLLKAGSAIADAASATKWGGLDAASAARGPGTIAKTVGRAMGSDTYADTATRMGQNVPILRMTGPVADKIVGGDGYYYRARSLLAAPYAVPGVRVAGTTVGQLGLAGAKVRGLATAESLVGGQTSPLSNAIDHMQTVNQLDDAIKNRLQFNAFGHHFAPGLNTLAFVMYPQIGSDQALSATVGKDISGLNDNVQNAFGPSTGFGLGVERGINWTSKGDQKILYDDLVKMAGGQTHFNQFWTAKTFEYVAAHLAEEEWAKMPDQEQAFLIGPGGFQDKAAVLEDLANGYLQRAEGGDIADMIRGAKEITSFQTYNAGQWGGHSGLSRMIAGEIDRSGMTPQQWLNTYMVPYGEASRIVRDVIIPRRAETIGDTEDPIGMVPSSYLVRHKAIQSAQQIEQRFRDAQEALTNADDHTPAAEKWQAFQKAMDDIRKELLTKYNIDGYSMPASEEDMISLMNQKADQQLPQVFMRKTATRLGPEDETPQLHASQQPEAPAPTPEFRAAMKAFNQTRTEFQQDPTNPELIDKYEKALERLDAARPQEPATEIHTLRADTPTGMAQLDRFTPNTVFTKMKPTEAMELIHEGEHSQLHTWTNDRRLLPSQGGIVTVAHDPADLRGRIDPSHDFAGVERQHGSARFLAQRNNGNGFDEGIQSVTFKMSGASKGTRSGTALTLMRDELQKVGYIKVEGENGVETWYRPDVVGGTISASPDLQQAFKDMEGLGMVPVLGKKLGSGVYNHHLLDFSDSHLTWQKRWIENLGLSTENVGSHDPGLAWQMNFHRGLLDAVEKYTDLREKGLTHEEAVAKGGVPLFPTHSPETIIAMLRDRKNIPLRGGTATWVNHMSPLGRQARDLSMQELTKLAMNKGLTRPQAIQQVQAEMSHALENPSGLLHITKRDLADALGHEVDQNAANQHQMELAAEFHGRGGQEMYDQGTRDNIYRLIQKANAQQPVRLVGWQKAENLTALGLSYMGRALPGSIGRTMEYLPTRLVTLRNKARFTLSPEFQLRRVVKVVAKGMLDDIPPTWHPVRELMRDGGDKGFQEKMAYFDHLMPGLKNPNYDEGTQYLYAEDPWGIYPGTRNYGAYFANEWKKMGKTDTEIRQMLVRNLSYGSKAYGEGRSTLERSMNFVFFPLSFDKTLYRNVGAYLLDHTAQRLVLQAGLEAYARYNASDPNGAKIMSSNWWTDHAPIIKEATRLNAFQYGLNLGQFGGINAPLLNFFIPQSYASTSQGLSVLKGFVPLAKQFQNIAQEAGGTWDSVSQLAKDQFIHIPTLKGFQNGNVKTAAEAMQQIFFAKPVAETPQASLTAAYQYRRRLQALFKADVDYNAHHTNKVSLGDNESEFGKFAGHVINATLVEDLVHQKYPAFAIDNPSVYYDQESAAIETYRLQMSAQKRPDVVRWIDMAQTFGKGIYNGKVDSSVAAAGTNIYRLYAIRYAETIPGFLTFYNANFRWQYGPLEGVR